MKSLSLVMIVKNESKALYRCLASVLGLVDEIVIVDTGSTDDTIQIAREHNAKIFYYNWNQDFAAARNYALDQSTSEWNLVLDADEFISNDCLATIREFIHSGPAIGRVKVKNQFESQGIINTEISYISRIFPKQCRYTGKVHEQIQSDMKRVILEVEISHDGYLNKMKSDRNIPILLDCIKEHPQDAYYHYQIAKEYRGLQQHIQAVTHLRFAYRFIDRRKVFAPQIIINYLYATIAAGTLEEGVSVIEDNYEYLEGSADFFFVAALFMLELILSNPGNYSSNLALIEQFYQRALSIGEVEVEGKVDGTGSYAAHHNLGAYYEATGQHDLAMQQYSFAVEYNYGPSLKRLESLREEKFFC
ncbi:glycosyltransferase family 2 protein [Paenibacillus sp. PAMC 26794]|uniref:glycosyltransferase family 2 protein n=1 Tax=Paenibacillus sp. PAMC 26794 TaxID=1257080 RepID=UPI0003120AAF|nr:glycosyltransferase family 2 protein [Paenibacillus sp. PAMC 26794]